MRDLLFYLPRPPRHLPTMLPERVRGCNQAAPRSSGSYVLYWMQMNRRVDGNHALAFAVEQANERGLPVLVYEGLTYDYPHANDRLHTFVLEGAPETARRLAERGIGYCFYPRRHAGDPNDVFYRLARNAAVVVTDDYPVFIAAAQTRRVAEKLDVALFAVDSSCIVPMNCFEKREYAAYTIRPKIHRLLPRYLTPAPEPEAAAAWKHGAPEWHVPVEPAGIAALVAACDIDHSIAPSTAHRGGRLQAEYQLSHFLAKNLRRYAKERNEPAAHATSNLSPYLHFGQISSLEIALAAREHAEEHGLMAGEFLEELIVRRELAFNFARYSANPQALASLPDWARETLRKHASDRREPCYSREELIAAATHDPLWNATQKEMLFRGKIHGYYRMYWGKKIIEWSRTCQDALESMIYIHDRWALDGRDPNTYTNILWCFGLHDRPWQERPIFGMVRFLSADGMKRKTDTESYLREIRHLEETGQDPFRLQ